jgi:hypothetical protein
MRSFRINRESLVTVLSIVSVFFALMVTGESQRRDISPIPGPLAALDTDNPDVESAYRLHQRG